MGRGADTVERGFPPTWWSFISFVKEEGVSRCLRVPGKAARQGAGREWWRSDVWARDEWRQHGKSGETGP